MYEIDLWCFGGMKRSPTRSKKSIPLREAMPKYRKTPKITAVGMSLRRGAKRMDNPTKRLTQNPVTR